IDYRNGAGSGAVIWRLGLGGDFFLDNIDPSLWFTHQHDPNFTMGHQLAVYDNGNLRCELAPEDPTCHSRGQVYLFDELTRHAALLVNTDLGEFSFALGSAQALSNGNFYFASGALHGPDGNV